MQNNFLAFQRSAQWGQIDFGQWIDNVIPLWPGSVLRARVWATPLRTGIADAGYNLPYGKTDLEQAKFLPIAMEAVGFRIGPYAISPFDLRKQLGELWSAIDHLNRCRDTCPHAQTLRSPCG